MPLNDFITEHKRYKTDQPVDNNKPSPMHEPKTLPKTQNALSNDFDENQLAIVIPVPNDQETIKLQPDKRVREYYKTMFTYKGPDRDKRLQELQNTANQEAIEAQPAVIQWTMPKLGF